MTSAHRAAAVVVPVLAGFGLLALGSAWAALGTALGARVAYVVVVGATLAREDARPRDGRAAALARWAAFRACVAWLMSADAVALGALCLVTRDSLRWPPPAAALAAGAALFALGLAVKRWATVSLPPGGYTWRDFFLPDEPPDPARGPYRFIANPMYTLGYAHAYGFALATRSLWGLCAAAFAQAAILAMHLLVERPHVLRRERRDASKTRRGIAFSAAPDA